MKKTSWKKALIEDEKSNGKAAPKCAVEEKKAALMCANKNYQSLNQEQKQKPYWRSSVDSMKTDKKRRKEDESCRPQKWLAYMGLAWTNDSFGR